MQPGRNQNSTWRSFLHFPWKCGRIGMHLLNQTHRFRFMMYSNGRKKSFWKRKLASSPLSKNFIDSWRRESMANTATSSLLWQPTCRREQNLTTINPGIQWSLFKHHTLSSVSAIFTNSTLFSWWCVWLTSRCCLTDGNGSVELDSDRSRLSPRVPIPLPLQKFDHGLITALTLERLVDKLFSWIKQTTITRSDLGQIRGQNHTSRSGTKGFHSVQLCSAKATSVGWGLLVC